MKKLGIGDLIRTCVQHVKDSETQRLAYYALVMEETNDKLHKRLRVCEEALDKIYENNKNREAGNAVLTAHIAKQARDRAQESTVNGEQENTGGRYE